MLTEGYSFSFNFSPRYSFGGVCPCIQVQTVVSKAAKSCTPSLHVEQLAKPKQRPEGPFRDPQWKVEKGALQAIPTERLSELSKPKKVAEGYQPSRDVIWKVGVGARNAVASNR